MGAIHHKTKLNILGDCLGEYREQGDEYLFKCPFCNHHRKKLSINLKKDVCKCWVCNWSSGSLYFLLKNIGDAEQRHEWSKVDESARLDSLEDRFHNAFNESEPDERGYDVDLPPNFHPLSHFPASKPIRYLNERGLDAADIHRWQIGYDPDGKYEGRVILPSFDLNGEVNFYVARSYKDQYPKYLTASLNKHRIIFNELYIDWDQDVHLVEGVFDAIMAGEGAVPLLGNDLKEDSKLMMELVKHQPDVYLALDSDVDDTSIAKMLLEYDIDCFRVPMGEYDDVGEMSYREYQERVEYAESLSINSIMMGEFS